MDLSSVTHSFPSMSYVQQSQEPANTENLVNQQTGETNLSLISDEAKNTLALAQNLGVEDLDFNPSELNKLNNLLNTGNKLMELSRGTPLNADQRTQLNAINVQIEQLFEGKITAFSDSELIESEDQINQQQKVDGLWKQLPALEPELTP